MAIQMLNLATEEAVRKPNLTRLSQAAPPTPDNTHIHMCTHTPAESLPNSHMQAPLGLALVQNITQPKVSK